MKRSDRKCKHLIKPSVWYFGEKNYHVHDVTLLCKVVALSWLHVLLKMNDENKKKVQTFRKLDVFGTDAVLRFLVVPVPVPVCWVHVNLFLSVAVEGHLSVVESATLARVRLSLIVVDVLSTKRMKTLKTQLLRLWGLLASNLLLLLQTEGSLEPHGART